MLLVSISVSSQIRFEKDFKTALKFAQRYDKKIFIDVCTQWCGPCKMMEKKAFQDQEAGSFFRRNYFCVKVDAEKGEGIEIAEKFNVRSYPTLLFLDKNGELIHRVTGGISADRLVNEAKASMSDDMKKLNAARKEYKAGNLKYEQLPEYIEMLYKVELDYSEPLERYFSKFKKKQLLTHETYMLLSKYSKTPNDYSFRLIRDNYKKLSKKVDKFNLDYFMFWKYVFQTYENDRHNKTNQSLYEDMQTAGLYFEDAVRENYNIVKNYIHDRLKDEQTIERTTILIEKYPFALQSVFNEIAKQTTESEKLLNFCYNTIQKYKTSQSYQTARLAASIASVFSINKRDYVTAEKYFGIAHKLLPANKDYKEYYETCSRLTGNMRPANYRKQAYDFELSDIKGKKHKLSDYKGKYVLLDFWASWCGPCKAEIPFLKEMHKKYSDNLVVISISSDKDMQAWKSAVKRENMTWLQLSSAGTDVKKKYNVRGIPRVMLLDKNGKIFGDKLRGDYIEKDYLKILKQ